MYSFSTLDRDIIIDQAKDQEFDLLIIGGGITGAGIALDAVSRGLKVALLEKQDFSQGTSSKSTKLVHGGLRYLKQGNFSLVREVGRERSILHQNAPHLVVPEPMMIPITKESSFGSFQISLALYVYDWLADVKRSERRRMLSASETLEKEPLLSEEGLKGGGFYYEYRTDDCRLVIEVLKTAIKYGAHCMNYMKVDDFLYEGGQIKGVQATDMDTNKEYDFKAKCVVNATGPWVDQVRALQIQSTRSKLQLTKGVHIVVKRDRLPIQNAIYFNVPDGRMAFAIPREDVCYIGTTDTIFEGHIDEPKVDLQDVYYILDAANSYFKDSSLTVDDVISSWAGLRPLIFKYGKSPSELSRKDEIFISQDGLVSIAGGKLTGYRAMSDRVVNTVMQRLNDEYNVPLVPCRTEFITLQGGDFRHADELETYKQKIEAKLVELQLDLKWKDYLIHRYGRQSGVILHHVSKSKERSDLTLIRSELWFCVRNELVYSLIDFLERRSGRLFFNPNSVVEALPFLLNDCVSYFKWNDERRSAEKAKIEEQLREITRFRVIA